MPQSATATPPSDMIVDSPTDAQKSAVQELMRRRTADAKSFSPQQAAAIDELSKRFKLGGTEQPKSIAPPAQPAAPAKVGGFAEAGRQVGNLVTGAVASGFKMGTDPLRAIGDIAQGGYETVKSVGRELAGREQPGQPKSTAPGGMAERLTGAASMALGGDPVRERVLKQLQGRDDPAAIAAGWTVPLLTAGLSALFPKAIPKEGKRANMLTAATNISASDIPAAYRQVLPRLDAVVKRVKAIPKTVGDMLELVNKASKDLESEFQKDLKTTIGPNRTVPTSVGDAIRNKITASMDRTAEGLKSKAALQARAVEFDKPWTYNELNEERMKLFRASRSPMAERIAQKNNTEIMADDAAAAALRDLIYGELEKTTNKPGYHTKLKRDEAAMFDLKDQLARRKTELSNAQAIKEGTPVYERNISMYGHPESGKVGTSMHGLQDVILGGAETRANRKVVKAFEPRASIAKRGVAASVLGTQAKNGKEDDQKKESTAPPPASKISVEDWVKN